MAINNEKFIILLGESKSTCGLKLDAFKETLKDEAPKPKELEELEELTIEAMKMYEEFADPGFTFVSFTFDEPKIRGYLADINEVEAKKENFTRLENHLNGMLKFLKETALKKARAARQNLSKDVINAVVLATVSQCATKITKRLNAKPEIDQGSAFQRRKTKQKFIKKKYRQKLNDNSIVGTESDVLHIKNIGILVSASKNSTEFNKEYDRLTDFMVEQIKKASA